MHATPQVIGLVVNFVPIISPLVSVAIDLLNVAISLARGNYADAALYGFAAIPIIGDAAQAGRLGMALKRGFAASNMLRQAQRIARSGVTQTGVDMTPFVIDWLQEAPSNSFVAGTGVVTGVDEAGNYITTAIEDLRVGDVVSSTGSIWTVND